MPKLKAGAGEEAGVVDPPPAPKLPKRPPPPEGAGGLAGVVELPKEKEGVEAGAAAWVAAGWPNSPPEAGGWLVSAHM